MWHPQTEAEAVAVALVALACLARVDGSAESTDPTHHSPPIT